MSEYVEACTTICSHKHILDYNCSQRKRLQCINQPKMH